MPADAAAGFWFLPSQVCRCPMDLPMNKFGVLGSTSKLLVEAGGSDQATDLMPTLFGAGNEYVPVRKFDWS